MELKVIKCECQMIFLFLDKESLSILEPLLLSRLRNLFVVKRIFFLLE